LVFRVGAKAECVWDEAEFQLPPLRSNALQQGRADEDQIDGVRNWLGSNIYNETLLQRDEGNLRDIGSLEDMIVQQERLVKVMDNRRHDTRVMNGNLAKATALDDDEDVD